MAQVNKGVITAQEAVIERFRRRVDMLNLWLFDGQRVVTNSIALVLLDEMFQRALDRASQPTSELSMNPLMKRKEILDLVDSMPNRGRPARKRMTPQQLIDLYKRKMEKRKLIGQTTLMLDEFFSSEELRRVQEFEREEAKKRWNQLIRHRQAKGKRRKGSGIGGQGSGPDQSQGKGKAKVQG